MVKDTWSWHILSLDTDVYIEVQLVIIFPFKLNDGGIPLCIHTGLGAGEYRKGLGRASASK